MQEYKIHNADLMFKEDSTVDDLIDMIEGNRRYVKCVYVYNKIDVCSMEEVEEIAGRPFSIPISCYHKLNLEGLLEMIWDMMVRSSTGYGWMWVGMCVCVAAVAEGHAAQALHSAMLLHPPVPCARSPVHVCVLPDEPCGHLLSTSVQPNTSLQPPTLHARVWCVCSQNAWGTAQTLPILSCCRTTAAARRWSICAQTSTRACWQSSSMRLCGAPAPSTCRRGALVLH